MKARITAKRHEFYNTTFNVSFLNYDIAAGIIENTKRIVTADFESVEFMFDAPWEESIVKNREILNIKKPREASYYMYFVIIKSIEAHLGEEVKTLMIIDDRDTVLKKMLTKNIVLVANGRPVEINLTGQRYSNVFSVRINDINREDFITGCQVEIEEIKDELKKYTKRYNELVYTMQSIYNNAHRNSSNIHRINGA
ncbi:hypothetical protein [Fonticella tunisiensis]|uniref:Uncharacterized protein n=1 Tax=Fonticella tunisiensis TaxID=1096341 RepID=A0A4R7KQA5_9CLOT|nr:hypothetical protein [Fonticella tunisiensis]TDT58455.1 hypothetical protein EDD71_111106 [Fonticella tunisiensis]